MIYSKLLPVISVALATVLTPVSAGIHDFNTENRTASVPSRAKPGQGQCITTADKSKMCYVKTNTTDYSVAILDVDSPGVVAAASINCSTGRWLAYGPLSQKTFGAYLNTFCQHF